MLAAGAFLAEFLSDGRIPALSSLTAAPERRDLPVPGAAVDLYTLDRLGAGAPLVLVHGFAPEGKDDPRLRRAAVLLARAGFDVAVPTIPGLTRGRLRPPDVEPVVATVAARGGPTILVGVSVGAGPALLAAADPRVRDRVTTVLSLGGYASALELIRFYLTGEYAYGGVRGLAVHPPDVVRAFVEANADLLDAPARGALATRDPARVARLLVDLPPDVKELLERLSPLRVARDIPGHLILVHGRADIAVPYTESLRLAAARPERTTLVLVGVVEHVEGAGGRWWQLGDLGRLWSAVYALLAGGA